MIVVFALSLISVEPASPPLQTLEDHARRGPLVARLDAVAAETARTCASACDLNENCLAWTWRAGWIGRPSRCDLHALALTPRPTPGASTGLSASLSARINAAIDREPTEKELSALDDASRARPTPGDDLAGG